MRSLVGHAPLNIDNVLKHFYWRTTGTCGDNIILFSGTTQLARLSVTPAA